MSNVVLNQFPWTTQGAKTCEHQHGAMNAIIGKPCYTGEAEMTPLSFLGNRSETSARRLGEQGVTAGALLHPGACPGSRRGPGHAAGTHGTLLRSEHPTPHSSWSWQPYACLRCCLLTVPGEEVTSAVVRRVLPLAEPPIRVCTMLYVTWLSKVSG